MNTEHLVAVDVGNSRLKAGIFTVVNTTAEQRSSNNHGCKIPELIHTHQEPLQRTNDFSVLASWFQSTGITSAPWYLSSVNPTLTEPLENWIRQQETNAPYHLLTNVDLPLQTDLPNPDEAGIDRLVNAVAANALRPPNRPAIIIDAGTAITIDVLSEKGVFLGGAILPGFRIAADALHSFTERLPLVMITENRKPPAIGTSTESAITSGLFWGLIGSMEAIMERQCRQQKLESPLIIVTGGDASMILGHLKHTVTNTPDLTLLGIAISAFQQITGPNQSN